MKLWNYGINNKVQTFYAAQPVLFSESTMPVIARFYGILIKMYFKEHGVPHFHAIYAEYNGVFDIQTLEMIEGDLPNNLWC